MKRHLSFLAQNKPSKNMMMKFAHTKVMFCNIIKIVVGAGVLAILLPPANASTVNAYTNTITNNSKIQQCYPDVTSAYQILVKRQKDNKSNKININTATVAQLVGLTGIGHTTAQAIIEYRSKQGKFTSIDDLVYVRGIGQATIDKNRSHLTLK